MTEEDNQSIISAAAMFHQNPVYSAAPESRLDHPLPLPTNLEGYSTVQDSKETSNVYAMITDSQICPDTPSPEPAKSLPPPLPPRGELEVMGRRVSVCLKACLIVLVILMGVVGVVMGVASLALYLSSPELAACGCNTSLEDVLEHRFQELEERNEQLSSMVLMLHEVVMLQQESQDELTGATTPPSTPVTTPTFNLNFFQDCSTGIEDTCTIPAGVAVGSRDFISCSTDLIVIHQPAEYVLNIQCLLVEETTDNNPLIATLDIADNQGFCRCFAATLNAANQVTAPVTCGMQVTRCTVPTNITARME